MTVSSETSKVQYDGNDSTTVFPYTFKVTDEDQLTVVLADADDNQTTLTLDTDYTVSGVGDASGGNVTYDGGGTPLATGTSITIYRDVSITQDTDFENQGGFFADTHEDAFDYLTFVGQQQQEELDRCLKVTVTSGDTGGVYLETVNEYKNAAAASETAAAASAVEADASATAAAASAVLADASATSAATSETNAAASAVAADASATDAKNYAATFPTIQAGDAEKLVKVNAAETGFDYTNSVLEKSIELPSRLDMKKDTYANLVTYAASATSGQLVYASDLKQVYNVKDSALSSIGGSGGETNFYTNGDADNHTDTSNFNSGGTGAFDSGSGTLSGNFTLSSASTHVIDGTYAFAWEGGGTALDNQGNYIASETIDIPLGYRGRSLYLKLQYKWTGTDDYMVWRVKDTTNGTILTEDTDTFKQHDSSDTAKEFTMSFYCPATCEQIEVGPQVLTGEISKVFVWDEVIINANPFISKEIMEYDFVEFGDANGHGSSSTYIRKFDTEVTSPRGTFFSVTNTSALGTLVTILKACKVTITYSDNYSAGPTDFGISVNSNQLTTAIGSITKTHRKALVTTAEAAYKSEASWTGYMSEGDVIRPHTTTAPDATTTAHFSLLAIGETEHIVHHDSGAVNRHVAKITNNGTAAIASQSSPDNPAVASVSRTGAGAVTVNFTTDFYGAIPIIDAKPYTTGEASRTAIVHSAAATGCYIVTENTNTGTNLDVDFQIMMDRDSTDWKNPHAYAVTPLEQWALVEDRKASTTEGGTATGNSVQTRDLNTVSGDTSIVTVSSNQFTLGAGTYLIEGSAPARATNRHQTFLYDVTNTSYIKDGTCEVNASGGDVLNRSFVRHKVTITSSTTYELRQWFQTTSNTTGLGSATDLDASNPQSNEVYAQVLIRQLKA